MKKMSLVGLISLMLIMGLNFIVHSQTGVTPSSVVKQFYTTVEKGDSQAVSKLLISPKKLQEDSVLAMFAGKSDEVSAMQKLAEIQMNMLMGGQDLKKELATKGGLVSTKETINGNKAIVKATHKDSSTWTFNLVKVDGKWKISGLSDDKNGEVKADE